MTDGRCTRPPPRRGLHFNYHHREPSLPGPLTPISSFLNVTLSDAIRICNFSTDGNLWRLWDSRFMIGIEGDTCISIEIYASCSCDISLTRKY